MSENSVVVINLKELHKIIDAYVVLNLTGVCVDYDDEMQMQFEKRIIVGKIVHKYPVYRDLRNGNNDCLVLEMKKAFPEESLLTEGKLFRFMILGNVLISKLLQVPINSFLGFMNFNMFWTFHSSEPSFSIGNLCGFVWIMPNLNFELSKVRNCKECIEKNSADYFERGEENCASRSRNCLWESRFYAQKKYTQETSCNKDYFTSVPKEKKNSNKYTDKVANLKTTNLFLRQSRDIRRVPITNKLAKSETGIDKDSVLVTSNRKGCLNTCLKKEKSSELRIHRCLNQVHHRKYTNICSKISVSSSKQSDNTIKRYDPNYFVNPLDEDCNSRTRVIFNDRQEYAKRKICECIRKNEATSLKTNELGRSRQCSETAVQNCVSNSINKKYDCINLNDNGTVQTEKLPRRNCQVSEKCHSGTNDYSKVSEAKINSIINVPAVEASERVQCWLDNIENLSLPVEHSTPLKNQLNDKGIDVTEIDSNRRKTKTEKDNLVSENPNLETKLITTKTNHKKRKLFYVDLNASGSPIKNHSEKTKRILSDQNCQEFENNFVDPEVLESRTLSKKLDENEEKIQEEILQQLLEFCAFKEDFDFDCISESNETKPIDSEIKLFPLVDSNHVEASSSSPYSTHEENQTENAALQINNYDENSPDLNKIVRTGTCNTTVSANPATNQEVNINSQQTQPYYDAEEISELNNSSVGSELKNIFKKLSEQSVTSLEKLFSYEDAEARETAISKLRKLNQKVQIKAVLVDMFPELNHSLFENFLAE
ncbi:uncharacterized protein isoform X2 [Rhodnius prolixus]|uniref:uncharacterized protein isoform X2 n=1 Tax=Rhodnius prolixus TaxID=13249 RepID=UPI003D18F8FA